MELTMKPRSNGFTLAAIFAACIGAMCLSYIVGTRWAPDAFNGAALAATADTSIAYIGETEKNKAGGTHPLAGWLMVFA
jgi:hypothetical protein